MRLTHPTEKSAPHVIAKSARETLVLAFAREFRETGGTTNVLQVRAIGAQSSNGVATTTPDEMVTAMLCLCSNQAGQVSSGARLPLKGAGL